MHFFDYRLSEWQNPLLLEKLDSAFLEHLSTTDSALYTELLSYRSQQLVKDPIKTSDTLIACAKVLDSFLSDFFNIKEALQKTELSIKGLDPIFIFKKWFVERRAKRRLLREEILPEFQELNDWLQSHIDSKKETELAVSNFACELLNDEKKHEEYIEKLTHWCIQAIKTKPGRALTKNWVSLKLPERKDYQKLIPIIPVQNDDLHRKQISNELQRNRDGFDLTDKRMSQKDIQSEVHYCIYCHDHNGDFCSKGFPEEKNSENTLFRKNPLGNTLTGCPLDEKISEMNLLKREAYTLGALAVVMIDNPMCPATGHRICNDCMKACIYQKQDPVNIPQIETRVLTDVLNLPWGVEIYDLLTRWNPLRIKQHTSKSYNGLKVFIAGLGPAGFTMAHHLLMEGFAVVATDGLKIEPLPEHLIKEPIQNFNDLIEPLNERDILGFGGVAEYGITARWDKNFLKLIYLNLARRPGLVLSGGVRFGGTVTVEDLWHLGFHHAVIAVGAGLPKALPIPNSMAKGMRQANDFLMALQLTGAGKEKSLANLQIRMPIVVIGGGLTGVDAATEAQAYYIKQVEKTLFRYEILSKAKGENQLRSEFSTEDLIILDEFINHAKAIRRERLRAKKEKEKPSLLKLLKDFGGVTIVYRRSMNESPAYISNHEELMKALEEGVYYLENTEANSVLLDEHHQCHTLVAYQKKNAPTKEHNEEIIHIPARTVLVATGAQPNIAYNFEHHGTFKKNGSAYQNYESIHDQLKIPSHADNVKSPNFGPFTSYQDEHDHRVSFIGDTHPVFHGNVVNAIASAMRTYPKILDLFGEKTQQQAELFDLLEFKKSINTAFHTKICSLKRVSQDAIEITIQAPMAVKKYLPGQFFRLQNYAAHALKTELALMQTEPLALYGFNPDLEKGTIQLLVLEKGASSRLCSTFSAGEPIALMGPTGVRTKIPQNQETILIAGNMLAIPYFLSVARSLKKENNQVIFIGCFKSESELFYQKDIESLADYVIYSTEKNMISSTGKNVLSLHGDLKTALTALSKIEEKTLSLNKVDRITLIGDAHTLKTFQSLRKGILSEAFKNPVKVYASVYNTMQCMLKGVCAQCLQWQIDPSTGMRTKAVFACSWQDEPIELIDLTNLEDRSQQNHATEVLTNAWLSYIFNEDPAIKRI